MMGSLVVTAILEEGRGQDWAEYSILGTVLFLFTFFLFPHFCSSLAFHSPRLEFSKGLPVEEASGREGSAQIQSQPRFPGLAFPCVTLGKSLNLSTPYLLHP